jgi:hypothetical protein
MQETLICLTWRIDAGESVVKIHLSLHDFENFSSQAIAIVCAECLCCLVPAAVPQVGQSKQTKPSTDLISMRRSLVSHPIHPQLSARAQIPLSFQ